MTVRIRMFADIGCPYSYLAAFRARRVLPEFGGSVELEPVCLPIEIPDKKATPKRILDAETGIVLLEEPDIPYTPWTRASSEWPVTMLPAFEAVKCAQRQGLDRAVELDWRLREAFFGESRCVSLRHVILDVAKRADLDMEPFTELFDSGACRAEVMAESTEGWQRLNLRMTPTFVLASGKRFENPAAPKVHLDESRNHRVVRIDPAPAQGEAALDAYREMFQEALVSAGEPLPVGPS